MKLTKLAILFWVITLCGCLGVAHGPNSDRMVLNLRLVSENTSNYEIVVQQFEESKKFRVGVDGTVEIDIPGAKTLGTYLGPFKVQKSSQETITVIKILKQNIVKKEYLLSELLKNKSSENDLIEIFLE